MLIATRNIVYRFDDDQPEQIYSNGRIRALAEADIMSVIVSDAGLVVISEGEQNVLQLENVDRVECADILPDGSVWIGTEGPHIFRLAEGSVDKVDSFDQFEGRDAFYTPWGGPAAVRSFAHTSDGCVYADIHVGSIIRSNDTGRSWEPVTPNLH